MRPQCSIPVHPHTHVDRARSASAARRARAQPGNCFRNAMVALGDSDLAQCDLAYIEGWVWDPAFQFAYHHGWNEATIDGAVALIDTSLYDVTDLAYFPVIRLPRDQAIALYHAATRTCRSRATGVLPFAVFARDELPSRGTDLFLPTRAMAEAWGQSAPPHRALSAVLGLLSAYTELDCSGMTQASHVLLTEAGVPHTPMCGFLEHVPSGRQMPHWWIDLADGAHIDFRARRMLHQPRDLPAGIVNPADWPAARYHGMPATDMLPPHIVLAALDVDWALLRAATQATITAS